MGENDLFKVYLPEFPLLHLRKSKIINLISAYKEAGLSSLVQFLQETDETDIKKILKPENIESATRFVKRLAMAIQIVLVVKFLESMSPTNAEKLSHALEQGHTDFCEWEEQYHNFIDAGRERNATFALHCDILDHSLEILAISLSEKIGGPEGYSLLLATVKSSLPFSFLNGASSYAGFCTQLLVHHFSAGHFHQRMKETLYTTPYKGSRRNFALDSQREMDHQV